MELNVLQKCIQNLKKNGGNFLKINGGNLQQKISEFFRQEWWNIVCWTVCGIFEVDRCGLSEYATYYLRLCYY